ncbi:MAG: RNA polymerase sigma factor [Romboutsia sp.]|uniref:RNA polymerase sigma factor n=1 Tax=Romboutsia sp. TaxID=1965302 RepID=UPI003F2FD26D
MDGIYKEHAQMIFKYLMSLCKEEQLAEELTQETFYRAIKSSNRYDGTCKISTWLCQIAKHIWYQELDKRARKGTSELNDETPSTNTSIEEAICLKENKMELMKQIYKLEQTSKEVVLLRITGAFSFKEIGEILNKNENWARVTYYRAKQKIAKGEII